MNEVLIIGITLILSAFFSGMEIAFVSSNKVYVSLEKMQGHWNARILTKLTQNPSKFIASMLIGNNIALVVYGFFMGKVIVQTLDPNQMIFSEFGLLLVQTLISTGVILVTAEFLPKVFFQIYANQWITFLAFPAYIFYVLFYPLSTGVIQVSDSILKRFFKTDNEKPQPLFSKIELGHFITEQVNSAHNPEVLDSEIQIFQNALEFSGVKARDIMVPRTEITAVEIHDPIEELQTAFVKTGYSKILVYQNSLDDIIGYVHSFALFKKPKTIKSITIPVEFVPETMFVKEILSQLTKKRKSVAIVLDEYGGTSGMLTVEDIVEELFGEIEDEHDDTETLIEEVLDKDVYLFSTRWDVEYLNETYKLEIPESDSYTTLGGFIVNYTKEIPEKGEECQIGRFQFLIEEASGNKVTLVKLTVLED